MPLDLIRRDWSRTEWILALCFAISSHHVLSLCLLFWHQVFDSPLLLADFPLLNQWTFLARISSPMTLYKIHLNACLSSQHKFIFCVKYLNDFDRERKKRIDSSNIWVYVFKDNIYTRIAYIIFVQTTKLWKSIKSILMSVSDKEIWFKRILPNGKVIYFFKNVTLKLTLFSDVCDIENG